MKAIVYEGAHSLAVRDMPMPQVPEGWAMVKISHAGICGTDLSIYGGTHPRAKAPLIMGHEFSGTLLQDTPALPKGTRVTAYPLLSCGQCEPCQTGNSHVCNTLRLLGIDCDGGMAEYCACPIDTLVPLPDGCTDLVGAFIEPIAVTVHAIRETGYVPGDSAIVIGAGNIGLSTALTLRKFGATDVIVAEFNPIRAALARELGFEVVNSSKVDLEAFAKKHCPAGGFDWVYDCAGVQSVADILLDLVKAKGHIVIVASYKKAPTIPLFQAMAKEIDFRFCRVYRRKDFTIAAQLAADPAYGKILTHVLPIDEAQKGFDLMLQPYTEAVKVIFRVGEGR